MFLLFFLKKSFPSAYLTKKPKKARLEHSVFQQDSRTHNNIVYSTDYSHAQKQTDLSGKYNWLPHSNC